MPEPALSGLFGRPTLRREAENLEHVLVQRPLQRILAFTGLSIHDVINDPLARRKVQGFYKLHKQIQRRMEITDLESHWNPLGHHS